LSSFNLFKITIQNFFKQFLIRSIPDLH